MGAQAPTTADCPEPAQAELEGEADAAALQQLIRRVQRHWQKERSTLQAAVEGARVLASSTARGERRRQAAAQIEEHNSQQRGEKRPSTSTSAQAELNAIPNRAHLKQRRHAKARSSSPAPSEEQQRCLGNGCCSPAGTPDASLVSSSAVSNSDGDCDGKGTESSDAATVVCAPLRIQPPLLDWCAIIYLAFGAEALGRIEGDGRIKDKYVDRLSLADKRTFQTRRRCSFSWMTDTTTLAIVRQGIAPNLDDGANALYNIVVAVVVLNSRARYEAMAPLSLAAPLTASAFTAKFDACPWSTCSGHSKRSISLGCERSVSSTVLTPLARSPTSSNVWGLYPQSRSGS